MSVYCPACGDVSPVRQVPGAFGDASECLNCGFVIETNDRDALAEFIAPSTILFADDSPLFRAGIEDALVKRELAGSILGAQDGQEFLEVFTWHLRSGNPVELAMLDVEMPALDGFMAAVGMRAVERAFDVTEPVPLMFFSAQPCNDHARQVLETCRPAIYINKESSPDLSALAERVAQVMRNVLSKRIGRR